MSLMSIRRIFQAHEVSSRTEELRRTADGHQLLGRYGNESMRRRQRRAFTHFVSRYVNRTSCLWRRLWKERFRDVADRKRFVYEALISHVLVDPYFQQKPKDDF